MMKHLVVLLLLYPALVLQSSSASLLSVGGQSPHWLLGVMMVALLTIEGWRAIAWAGCLGLLGDCLSGERMGTLLICYTLVAYVIDRLFERRVEQPWPFAAIVGFLAVFIALLAATSVQIVATGHQADAADLLLRIFLAAMATTVLSTSVLLLIRGTRFVWHRVTPASEDGPRRSWKLSFR